jgi:hypothetical protein
MRNLFGFYAISRQQGKAKSGKRSLSGLATIRPAALKDRSLKDKNKSSDG